MATCILWLLECRNLEYMLQNLKYPQIPGPLSGSPLSTCHLRCIVIGVRLDGLPCAMTGAVEGAHLCTHPRSTAGRPCCLRCLRGLVRRTYKPTLNEERRCDVCNYVLSPGLVLSCPTYVDDFWVPCIKRRKDCEFDLCARCAARPRWGAIADIQTVPRRQDLAEASDAK